MSVKRILLEPSSLLVSPFTLDFFFFCFLCVVSDAKRGLYALPVYVCLCVHAPRGIDSTIGYRGSAGMISFLCTHLEIA